MNACRNDGGIVHTPYGEYVIVLMNKDFHDIIEYNDHPSMVYGARGVPDDARPDFWPARVSYTSKIVEEIGILRGES